MRKFITVIVAFTILFLNLLPVSASAQSTGNWLRGNRDERSEKTWIDTSRWENRRVEVESARPARYENKTVIVSNSRTEIRVIPEVRENRNRWIPPVMDRRWGEISPAVSEQGFWRTENIPAVTRQRRVITRYAQAAQMGWIDFVRISGYWEYFIHVITPPRTETRTIPAVTEQRTRTIAAVTERRWFVTQEAQPARYSWMNVVITPGRTETRWIPAVTREERYQVTISFTFTERVRVSDGRWTLEARWTLNGFSFFPVWIPPVYQNVTRTGTRTEWRTRTVVVTPGRNETVWIPPVTEWRNVRVAAPVPERGEWRNVVVTPQRTETYTFVIAPSRTETRTIPAVTEQRSRWIPPVMDRRWGEVVPAVSEQGHWVTDIITPARTENTWVVTRAAQSAQFGWIDFERVPGRTENYSVVIAPATTVTDHIPAVTRIDRVQVEAARPARYEDRTEFVRDGRYENITGNVVLKRDREYVFTSLRRPPNRSHDMSINVKHNINVAVTNISAVHVVERFRNLGQMHVVPVSSTTRPDGSIDLHFNYERPGTAESTLYVRLHLANDGLIVVQADIPINGLSFTERTSAPPLRFEAAISREGVLDF